MKKRSFGNEARKVSEIGLGTWQLGGDWGKVDEDTAEKILEEAIAKGIDFIDTADVYGNGKSEERIGRFLHRTAAEVFVATKVGRYSPPGGHDNFTFSSLLEHTEASLSRLGRDHLDLLQLHCVPTEVLRDGEIFDSLRRLKENGKILRFGASVETVEEAHLCLDQEGLSSLQIIFNVFRQKPMTEIFEKAQDRGVALIVRLPLASGLLSGKFACNHVFARDDHRSYNRNGEVFNVGETFAGLPFETGVELTDKLAQLLPERMTLREMAMRWILDQEAVTVVIPGATCPEQVRENASVSDHLPLPEHLHEEIRKFYEREVEAHIRGPY